MALSEDQKIQINFNEDFATYLEGTNTPITVTLFKIDGSTSDITLNVNTSIFTLDDNIYFDQTTKTLYFKNEGTAVLKAIYTNSFNETYVATQKFVVYKTFFKDNYNNYLVSTFEKLKLAKNKKLKIMMDTMMEMLDILYAYNIDAKLLSSFSGVKSEFLDLLGQNVGFERIDYESVNTSDEDTANKVYKELLANIFELINIRGTNLSYELFFNALGYNIKLEEFWYNDQSNLIEINPTDDSLSSYYRYDTNGINLDSPPFPNKDPRRFINTQDVFVNNKSNYVRPILTSSNTNIAPTPSSFTIRKRNVIKKYLEYLRPSHVQYIQELIAASLTPIAEIITAPEDELFLQYILIDVLIGAEDVDNLLENFSTSTPSFLSEEYSFKKKWDTGLKWDSGHKWDDKQFLAEVFAATPI